MGNGVARLARYLPCGGSTIRRRHVSAAVSSEPYDEGFGHSFCYLRPEIGGAASKPSAAADSSAAFRSISGAAVSANASTPLSTADPLVSPSAAAAFESSTSFSSAALHLSGPLDRRFLSGPLDRGPLSGPLDPRFMSGPLNRRRPLRRLASSVLRRLSGAISGEPRSTPHVSISAETPLSSGDLQWAQGKAGEDRVHVVISEEHGCVFVGIYDGFNGPDATDYLLSNLYPAVQNQLKGLIWDDDDNNIPVAVSHSEVLNALSLALEKTEEGYLDIADKMVSENPELALMGSCVLVMLMKGDDVYLMNVGDSRAVLARVPDVMANVGSSEEVCEDHIDEFASAVALQLTLDHSTCVKEEVRRIRNEHPDDSSAIVNDRVKGSLKVTRAFGAGFLKQPKWNDALLEMFRIDYVGTSPYLTCRPFLHHHKLGPKDRFLILSSDGLYQYFTNEEAVAEVELFLAGNPDGDPAQHLVEEVLFRAAENAGMDFHELLEIPQGDRRRYHDDVSIIVISLEGRIWRSFV